MQSNYLQVYKPAPNPRWRYWLLSSLLLLAIILSLQSSAQPNITRVEYYIDTDPGFGNATALSIPGNTSIITDASIAINPANITEGVHRLYVRAKSANGWSLTNQWLFYKPYSTIGSGAQLTNINRIEYYYDTDPGFGNATALPAAASTDLANLIIPVNPTGLAEGVHRLYVRARSGTGWSLTNQWLFYKPYSTIGGGAQLTNINRIEYYFDTDPGFGNATQLPASAATELADLIIPVDPTSLTEGVHLLYVRARSGTGWGLTNRWLFYKPYTNFAKANSNYLTNLEYYIDTDPGYGSGIPVAIEQVKDVSNAQLFINISGYAAGVHRLHVRGQDSTGSWSLVNDQLFNITTAQASPSLIVNSITRTTFCARDSFTIGYHVAGTYNAGNTFKAFLSDAAGSFTNETEIGTITSIKSGLITCYLPSHLPDGTGYKLRVKSSNTALTGATSSFAITIHDRPSAQTITGKNFVNGTYTWPYNVTNVATSTYNWQINGGNKASGANTNAITATFNQPAGDSAKGYVRNIETNQYGCVGDTSLLSPVVIYKLDIGDTVVANVCKGTTLTIKTGATGSFDAGNNLIAELSDASGVFSSPVATVSKAFTANGVNKPNSFDMLIPAGLPNGTNYRVRIRSTSPAFTGDTSAAISIIKPDIGADRNGVYCLGYGYNLKQFYTDNNFTYGYYTNAFIAINRPDSVQAGTYKIIGTNSIGCTDTATISVTSNPSPSLGADTSVYHVCAGDKTNLLPLYTTTGLTAVWNTATPSSVSPGTYRLVVTNNFGCTDTAFANVILETATWKGTVSNNWHTAANWSTNIVPSERTHVIIPASTPNPCVLKDANGIAASIQVKPGGNMQVTNSRTLDIKGKCTTLPSN